MRPLISHCRRYPNIAHFAGAPRACGLRRRSTLAADPRRSLHAHHRRARALLRAKGADGRKTADRLTRRRTDTKKCDPNEVLRRPMPSVRRIGLHTAPKGNHINARPYLNSFAGMSSTAVSPNRSMRHGRGTDMARPDGKRSRQHATGPGPVRGAGIRRRDGAWHPARRSSRCALSRDIHDANSAALRAVYPLALPATRNVELQHRRCRRARGTPSSI